MAWRSTAAPASPIKPSTSVSTILPKQCICGPYLCRRSPNPRDCCRIHCTNHYVYMKKILILLTICAAGLMACKPEHLVLPGEPMKQLSGNWQIIKATRNGTDLTTRFDFSHFRIQFTDSSYTIDSLVPFIVSKNGKWA